MQYKMGSKNKEGESPEKTMSAKSIDKPINSTSVQCIIKLQQTIGNRALKGLIQAKLNMSQSNDPLEREADRVAEETMRMPVPASTMERKLASERVAGIADGLSPENEALTADRINLSGSGGYSLPSGISSWMGSRMGMDFGNVRIHTDPQAAKVSGELNAQAFTTGNDIYFGTGKYDPVSNEGKKLLAHELTHVIQQSHATGTVIQRFEAEDAAVEMPGRPFIITRDIAITQPVPMTIPKGSTVTITTWSNSNPIVQAKFSSGGHVYPFAIEKKYLTPISGNAGLQQYHSGATGIKREISRAENQIDKKKQDIADWKAKESQYARNHSEWERQLAVKKTELADLQYKLNGEGYTPQTLPERLKKNNPLQTQLNKALIEETMFNAFDANIEKWVKYYNDSIGKQRKWKKLDPNIVKSMIYQESHMGTHGKYLYSPPYSKGQRMTRFNIGQTIDSSGPQLILMIQEISPAIASKYNLDKVTPDMYAAKERRKELKSKGSRISAAEATELNILNSRSLNGRLWNHFYETDPRWSAAVAEFFTQTAKPRNLDYDFWIRTLVRWLFEKRMHSANWEEAVKAYNGSGPDAEIYKKDVFGRIAAAEKNKTGFIPEQHY